MLGRLRSLAIIGLATAALPLVGSLPVDHELRQPFERHVRTTRDEANSHVFNVRQQLSEGSIGAPVIDAGNGNTEDNGAGGGLPNTDPPTEDPPTEDPPAEDPPAEDPPAEDPPAEDHPAGQSKEEEPEEGKKEEGKTAQADEFYLRIMPLGASITEGKPAAPGDKEGNGYRKYLRDHLRKKGWQVNMVGSRQWGTMKDNDHEGKHGDTISQVEVRAQKFVRGWLPNIVLINAGTNDAREGKLEGAEGRMRSLVDTVFSRSPDAVVVLSTLLPSDHQDEIDKLNEGIRNLAREYIYDVKGKVLEKPQRKLLLAEMVPFIKLDDIHDGVHPTVDGFKKMASVWADAIDRAHDRGWLQKGSASSKMPDEDPETCRKPFGSGDQVDSRGGTQILWAANEVIADDGPYRHEVIEHKDFIKGKYWDKSLPEDRLYFANLVKRDTLPGEELDDMIMVQDNTDNMRFKRNNGDGEFGDWVEFKVTSKCQNRGKKEAAGVRWADVNGDGLDDFVCISPEGEMYVAINQGAAEKGKAPTFGETFKFRSSLRGRSQLFVQLADIDGDGRVDFCVLEDNGDVYCERNGGTGDGAEYWQDMSDGKPIFTGKGKGDFRGVRFVDLNGDGRWDWMWMDEEGKTETFFNYPGDGKGMMPRWVDAGVTHQGMHKDIRVTRKHVVFGRIFGTGRNDYVNWEADANESHLNIHVWENVSKGGRLQKGDGVFFGDLTKTGFDDYVFISFDGQVHVFRNTVDKKDFENYDDKTWDGPYDALKTGLSRRALHVADWNGDGHADVIGVTDRRSGAIAVWETQWDGKSFSWNRKDIGGSDKCKHGWGRQQVDHAAHFADIDGDGRADYLCMDPAGTITALLNTKDELKDVGQVKYSEKLDRANFRFADANGDGKADLIWVDKFNGDGKIWYNQGMQKDREGLDGSIFLWDKPAGVSYQGSHRGPNMHFPVLGGHRRADMVGVEVSSAKAWLWYNSCGAGGDGSTETEDDGEGNKEVGEDDSESSSPLPSYEGSDPDDMDPEDAASVGLNDNGKHFFCGTSSSTWDKALWDKHDVGSWAVKRCETYSHIDSKWPDSVPRTFAEYNLGEKDDLWAWDGTCTAIDEKCSLSEGLIKSPNECPSEYKRAMWLWSARNYARYLQRLWDLSERTLSSVALLGDDMIEKFKIPDVKEKSPSPWLSLTMALSTFAGLLPLAATSMGAVAGGIIAANAFIAMFAPPPEDQEYQEWSEIMKKLSKESTLVRKGITALFNHFFSDTPPNNDIPAGTELAGVLKDGQWLSSDAIVDTYNFEELRTSLLSTLVNNLLQGQQTAIIRWSDDRLRGIRTSKYGTIEYSPCNGLEGPDIYARSAACIDDDKGTNYAFVTFANSNPNIFETKGLDPETLAQYNLTQADVIMSSFDRQRLSNKWLDVSLDHWSSLVKLSEDQLPPTRRLNLGFNLPICDLDALDQDSINLPKRSETLCDGNQCLSDVLGFHCQRLELGGEKFPYKWSRKIKTKTSLSENPRIN